MNLFSNLNLQGRVVEVTKRFPIPVLFSIFTTIALILTLSVDESENVRWAIAGFIGFLAVFNWDLAKQAYRFDNRTNYIGLLLILGLLICFFWSIPQDKVEDHTCFWYFSGGLSILLHLLVSVIPYLKDYKESTFINYNIKLFLSWMQAAFYGIILYFALNLAIIALDNLFDIEFSNLIYVRLFILIGGIFHVFFFLSEVPDDFYEASIPQGKSIFKTITSYVFIPVVIVYGVILLAYLIKFMILSEFVEWVSYLINFYFIIGIFTYLFSCYFENDNEAQICRWYKKWFFIISGPMVVFLFIVLYDNYTNDGVTEEIYISILAAIFILTVRVYLMFRKNGDKRIFPLTLMILTLIAMMSGPFSLCNLPVINIQERLIKDFETMGLIENGHLVFNDSISHQDSSSLIQSKLSYLESRKRLDFLDKYDADGILKKDTSDVQYVQILKALNIHNDFSFIEETGFRIYNTIDKVIELEGFDKMIPICGEFNTLTAQTYLKVKGSLLSLVIDGVEMGTFNAAEELYKLSKNQKLEKVLKFNIGRYFITIYVSNANADIRDAEFKNLYLEGIALIKSTTE